MMMCKRHTKAIKAPAGPGRTRWLRRLATATGGALLTAYLVVGWSHAGIAALPQDDPFAGLEVLGAAELAEKRGGFLDAALGIRLNLAADIRRSIGGELVLLTRVRFAESGTTSVTHEITPGTPATVLAGLAFLSADGAPIAAPDGTILINGTSATTFTASNGTQVTVPAGFEGLVAQNSDGVSVAADIVSSEQFANLVINATPGAIIRQELNIDISVEGFARLQQTVRANATLSKFREAMRSASLGALGSN